MAIIFQNNWKNKWENRNLRSWSVFACIACLEPWELGNEVKVRLMSFWLLDLSQSLEDTVGLARVWGGRDNMIHRTRFFLASNSPTKLHNTSTTLLKHLDMFWDNNFMHTQR